MLQRQGLTKTEGPHDLDHFRNYSYHAHLDFTVDQSNVSCGNRYSSTNTSMMETQHGNLGVELILDTGESWDEMSASSSSPLSSSLFSFPSFSSSFLFSSPTSFSSSLLSIHSLLFPILVLFPSTANFLYLCWQERNRNGYRMSHPYVMPVLQWQKTDTFVLLVLIVEMFWNDLDWHFQIYGLTLMNWPLSIRPVIGSSFLWS